MHDKHGLVPFLTAPKAGIDGPAFDVVILSLLGYGFSERSAVTDGTTGYTAELGWPHLWPWTAPVFHRC